jgi:hypothetical protein
MTLVPPQADSCCCREDRSCSGCILPGGRDNVRNSTSFGVAEQTQRLTEMLPTLATVYAMVDKFTMLEMSMTGPRSLDNISFVLT